MTSLPIAAIVQKHAGPFVDPTTFYSTDQVPVPSTDHSLEVVAQEDFGTGGVGVWARFSRSKPKEAWIAHRHRHMGNYRLEPLLAVSFVSALVRGDESREQEMKRQEQAARLMQKAVSDFNKTMRRAERLASGYEPESWWRRAWWKATR